MGLRDAGTSEKRRVAEAFLRSRARRLVVALSGGVDSAVLLDIAAGALGAERVVAVTGRSASLPEHDGADAVAVAHHLGVRHRFVETAELTRAEYRANRGDRCYFCREVLFERLREHARQHGYDQIAYGAIVDDVGDFRPGMRAAEAHGVLAPLLHAGMTKRDIRALADACGLPVRDKPAAACLASRVPVGTEVTTERLGQVGRAEAALRRLGFRQFRVRHHGDIARIELGPGEHAGLVDSTVRTELVREIKAAGFRYVAVDLEGYRPAGLDLYRIEPKSDGGQ